MQGNLAAIRKRLRIQQGVIAVASLAMAVFVLVWLIMTALTGHKHGIQISARPKKAPVAFEADSSSSSPSADVSSAADTAAAGDSAADSEPEEDDSSDIFENAAMKDDFSDAAFIGDSRTVGLELNGGKAKASFFASTGLNVSSALTDSVCALSNGNMGTVVDAVSERKFYRVFVMFGINEMGWYDLEAFADNYVELIRQVKEAQPDAKVYVISVLPVASTAADENETLTNENVDNLNTYVRQAAMKAGVEYLDANSYFKDEKGTLPEDAATDGVHFTRDYYLKLINMLAALAPQTHPMTAEEAAPIQAPVSSSSEDDTSSEEENTEYNNGYDNGYDTAGGEYTAESINDDYGTYDNNEGYYSDDNTAGYYDNGYTPGFYSDQ